jgi:pantoate--beta-alanine ligase
VAAARAAVAAARGRGLSVGLVPTMGALHGGHASLIRAARGETGFVVVSIFVNPTQFGPGEDLGRYPRTPQHDLQVCAAEGTDLVFAPAAGALYPPGFCTYVEVHGLQHVLCGTSRPTHFRGVATVVLKLLHAAGPDVAYFGQKDAQQFRVIEQMVRDLDVPVRLRMCPIVREADGLALSSRNHYLDPAERRQAVVLSQALDEARRLVEAGERDGGKVRRAMAARVGTASRARLDYAAVVDFDTLVPLERMRGRVLIAVAAYFGGTRLIDNVLLGVDERPTSTGSGVPKAPSAELPGVPGTPE